ncbi:linoleate diol synthase [Fistulina hepatica ATCC 64428]|uniref:Linoleate diol synthase n=1 Tax=Fistulina hepatica ATCC 64428 TaxID=1128425 RepID=A0A0D7ANN9_9AGAR|nr:linoleate diol synthase [Fistulina hepatica ATCC 64428]
MTPCFQKFPSYQASLLDVMKNSKAIDDRKLLLLMVAQFVSRLPEGSWANEAQNLIIKLLYDDLPHPPATGVSKKYAYRRSDGAYNNINIPDMGKAGTAYARSVQQTHPLPTKNLPDAGLIFDTLLKRDKFVPHPGGLSSMMFSFAALVIHTVFRTSHDDVGTNETSSYVDLAPLYGNNEETTTALRRLDGRGLLYPDVFAEDRLLLLPPSVCVLLVLFSRNHNYIAKKLYEINERGTFRPPRNLSGDKLRAQDDEIFETARLVNVSWFASAVFSDYFSAILGLVREGSSWSLAPFGEIRNEDHSFFERGRGNACSVEFNCLYRWHATTSRENEQWVTELLQRTFQKPVEDITIEDYFVKYKELQGQDNDMKHWTFGALQRQEDGTFKDEELAEILYDATESEAAAFRARGTPAVMRLHEMMGIEANRRWGVCSMNDFRQFLGLKPYTSFKDWNSDPEIADVAEKLYGHIDFLELYVGLQAEEAKPLVDGAGLCPGYTISRAILSDAIALTRGDRFFTYDYTPYNMTAWGFADCQRDPNGFGFGSTLGRLILRTLPNDFTDNSVYAFFPLMTPKAMRLILDDKKLTDQYDLARPVKCMPTCKVTGRADIVKIMDNRSFVTPYELRASKVCSSEYVAKFLGGSDDQEKVRQLLNDPSISQDILTFFADITEVLIRENSYKLVGGEVQALDVVRDVLKAAPIHWVATELGGIKLKTRTNKDGVYTAEELFNMLGDIYSFIFLDVEAPTLMALEINASKNIKDLQEHINEHLGLSLVGKTAEFIDSFVAKLRNAKKDLHGPIVRKLHDIVGSPEHVAGAILVLMISASVDLSIALTNVLNYYLDSKDTASIRKLAANPGSNSKLEAFVLEALLYDPTFEGVYRMATQDCIVGNTEVKNKTRVFLDIAAGNSVSRLFLPTT